MSDGVIGEKAANPSHDRIVAAWTWHLCALAACVLALGAGFASDIRAAVTVWWIYPAYSHCFLIIPISAWLIWEKRDIFKTAMPQCSPWILLAAIPLFLFWGIGKFASITEVRQFAFVGFVEIFIAALLGWAIFRQMAFACLYLFFLVPTGQYLIPYLQDTTAKFVEWGLSVFSIPYFRDGLVFELINGRYEIAEACAGLRFLIATVALGVLFAHLIYRNKTKIAIFLAACFIVPVIGNGIRALLTVMVANYSNNRIATGFDHIVYGWVFAVAIIMLILFVGSKYPDAELPAAAPGGASLTGRFRLGALAGSVGGIVLLVFVLVAVSRYADADAAPLDSRALEQAVGSNWSAAPSSLDWRVDLSPATLRLERSFAPQTDAWRQRVDLAIYYYARGAKSASMLNARNHAWQSAVWHAQEHHPIRRSAGNINLPIDEYVIGAGDDRRLVWTSYWIDGYFTTTSPVIRLLELRSGLIHGHSAIIVLSTRVTGSDAEARARLQSLLSSLKNLSAGLSRAGQASNN